MSDSAKPASPFWKYFAKTLHWSLFDKAGPLQAIGKGLAHRLDGVKEDALFLRNQWFPQKCEPELVPEYGHSRGLVRHHTETAEQFRQRVIGAYEWHMLGGKHEGLPQILQFYGFDIAGIESLRKYQNSRWAEFQVGLHNPQQLADQNAVLTNLHTLVWLINEYKPARSILARLYTDAYNITPLIWSEGKYSEHFYSHFSGVPISDLGEEWDDNNLIISFGLRFCTQTKHVDYGAPTFAGLQRQGFITPYIDAPVWSQFKYSDDFPQKHSFTIGELLSLDWCVRTTTSYPWDGVWDARHWQEASQWDRVLPQWSMHTSGISRSQLVYADIQLTAQSGIWSGLNASYSVPTAVVITKPAIWGSYVYSDCMGRKEVTIHEQYTQQSTVVIQKIDLPTPQTGMQGRFGAETSALHNRTWSDDWNNRRWYSYCGQLSITSYPKE